MVRDELAAMLAARKSVKVVQTCADGESAVAYVRSNGCPDIILSDVRMPGIDGFETIARLRRYHPRARVLLLAGMPLREECERAKSCGAAGYMSKSADIDRLVQAISGSRAWRRGRGRSAARSSSRARSARARS